MRKSERRGVSKHAQPGFPRVIQIEQDGRHLIVLKIVAVQGGQRAERDEYAFDDDNAAGATLVVSVRSTSEGTALALPNGRESWTITAGGQLIVHCKTCASCSIQQ